MQHLIKNDENSRHRFQICPDLRPVPVDKSPADNDRINYRRAQSITLDKAVLRENRVLTDIDTSSFSEAYQLLHIQVLRHLKENNWNSLAVTSPGTDEGKSLTAINLAISLSREIGYTVLLVDLNLRQPDMLKHFGLKAYLGLSDFLTDDLPVEALFIQPGHLEDLVILPGGMPLENSTEMLNSPKMAQLVADLKSCDPNCIIIYDLPPVLASAEAMSFAPLTDAALLVIEDGVTRKHDIERAMDRLSCTNIVGTVLNKT